MSVCTVEVAGHDPVAFECTPAETILDAAARAGWELPYSCRRGICDTCRATVLSGEVSVPVTEGSALLCQAKACGDVRIAPDRIERVTLTARKKIRAKLYRVRMAAPDVAIVDLRFPAGIKAQFKAGQYLQVLLDGEVPRSFSMANAPKASDSAQLQIRVLPGSLFASQVLPALQPGDPVDIELPSATSTCATALAPCCWWPAAPASRPCSRCWKMPCRGVETARSRSTGARGRRTASMRSKPCASGSRNSRTSGSSA